MKSVDITNIRKFTTLLFAGDTFDGFLTAEASFTTAATFTIDGHVNTEFVGKEELELPQYREGMVFWQTLRPICFAIIKGKKVPSQFKIIFKLAEEKTQAFLKEAGLSMEPEQISGLYLNIHFREGKLMCTTGAARKVFSMDKSLEAAWDTHMERFLNHIDQ